MKRFVLPTIALVAAALVSASPAAARTNVSHFSFQGVDQGFSRFLTRECGLPVTVRVDTRETDVEYANGAFAAIIHFKATYITEAGAQAMEDDNFRVFVSANEEQITYTGVPFKVIDPATHRVVIKDRGWIRFTSDSDQFIAHGPHPSVVAGFDLCTMLT